MLKQLFPKYFVFLLLLVLLFYLNFPILAQVRTESESNNRREEANEILLGETLEGLFQTKDDHDWYKLIISQAGKNIIRVDLSGVPNVNAALDIYSETGTWLKHADLTREGQPEAIINFGVEEGIYYIVARGYQMNETDKYTLNTKLIGPRQEGQEFEPNDKQEMANEIHLGERMEGFYHPVNDHDWYKLAVEQPGKNVIRIELSGIAGVNSFFTICDDSGKILKRAESVGPGEAEACINFGVTEGNYYIDVSSVQTDERITYTLTAQLLGPWKEGQEFEVNDRKEQANPIRLGESIKGFFHPRDDQDWYALDVDQPGKSIIRINLSGVADNDSTVSLYDEAGNRLKDFNTNRKGEPETVPNFGVEKGIYYIRLISNWMNDSEEYTLSAKLLGPWKEDQEFEPNDRQEKANEIELDQEIRGYCYPHDDRDWYFVTVSEPGIDILVAELSAIPEVDLFLQLYDPKGTRPKQANIGRAGEEEMIVRMKVPPGKYYFVLNSDKAEEDIEYKLRIGKPTRPPASPEEVREALRRALDSLSKSQGLKGFWPSRYTQNPGIAGLCLMAFIGGDCAEKDYSLNITKTIDFLKNMYRPSSSFQPGTEEAARFGGMIAQEKPMYEHAIATLALTEALVDLKELNLEPIIEDALQLIFRAQNTEHKPALLKGPVNPDSPHYGGWRYHPNSVDSDISITGWQVLALKGALNAGFTVPKWTLPKAVEFIRTCYIEKDGSFSYQARGQDSSCVRAGVGAICLHLTGNTNDPRIPPALRFMQDNPPVWNIEEPGSGYPFYYWYYGTRAMLQAGNDNWRIWKDWMCRFLIDHQNSDGTWEGAQSEEKMNVYTTALGSLMLELCCGHVPMYMRERIPRPGYVEVVFEEGKERIASKNVEIILDASNSMWGQIAGEAKISIAKNVLEQIINGLPDEMNVGLRLYGHRYGLNDQRACQDTELKVPIGPINKSSLIDIIKNIQPKGKTPLVYSVLQAGNDFQNIQGGSIILITDGVESCDGDIDSIGPALKKLGIDLKVHIVGFDIKEAEARAELEAIAKSTEGTYLDAKDSQELLSSLEQTLQIEFEILDEKGQVRAKGLVGGEAIRIMEGSYILRLLVDPKPFETAITVNPGQKSTFVLTKQQDEWVVKK